MSSLALSFLNRVPKNIQVYRRCAYPLSGLATAANPAHIPNGKRKALDFEDLTLFMTENISLIDVRNQQELEKCGEIPGSLNIPLNKVKEAFQLSDVEWKQKYLTKKPSKNDKIIIFYARGPNASGAAVEIMQKLGFKNSRHYAGGWEDYCRHTGTPLEKNMHKEKNDCGYYPYGYGVFT